MIDFIKRFTSRNSLVKTLLLKALLTDEEKRFFSLIAPEDSVKTKNENGYLYAQGWWQITQQEWSRDGDGQIIPWYTYPSIDFLRTCLNDKLEILEFGGGSSTLFFAARCHAVTTMEHDADWAKRLAEEAPSNCTIINKAIEPFLDFASAIPEQSFHLIVVDGRQREKCLDIALKRIKPEGIIILDDAERERYAAGKMRLLQAGFKELGFWGLRHHSVQKTCTSVFYRPSNCLGL